MKIVKLHAIPSTNDYLRQLLRENVLQDWTVITTQRQEKGRGQRGNIWYSEPGKNITISIYRSKLDKLQHIAMLHRYVSVGIADFLEKEFGISADIKWPNDILSGGRKIAGILIENNFKGSRLSGSIIGIGLNLNQASFPSHLNATSVLRLTGQPSELDESINRLVQYLQSSFRESENHISTIYRQKLFGLNQPGRFIVDGKSVSGIVRGVSLDNQLIIEGDDGLQYYNVQEVKWQL